MMSNVVLTFWSFIAKETISMKLFVCSVASTERVQAIKRLGHGPGKDRKCIVEVRRNREVIKLRTNRSRGSEKALVKSELVIDQRIRLQKRSSTQSQALQTRENVNSRQMTISVYVSNEGVNCCSDTQLKIGRKISSRVKSY